MIYVGRNTELNKYCPSWQGHDCLVNFSCQSESLVWFSICRFFMVPFPFGFAHSAINHVQKYLVSLLKWKVKLRKLEYCGKVHWTKLHMELIMTKGHQTWQKTKVLFILRSSGHKQLQYSRFPLYRFAWNWLDWNFFQVLFTFINTAWDILLCVFKQQTPLFHFRIKISR